MKVKSKSLNMSKTIAKYVNGKIINMHNNDLIFDINNYVKLEDAIEMLKDILTDYDKFLLENGYTDSDVWCEPPTAIDRFLFPELNK
jgi:predicted translin family RNA/ssDNA-binding protein